jgi:uncharacterized protein (DUF488 family)
MYTYFYHGINLKNLPNIVSISRTITHGTSEMMDRLNIKYTTYAPLFPDWSTMIGPYKSGQLSEEEYENRYMVQLNQLDPHKVVNDLGSDAVLICYEESKKFCHRHIVSKWLNEAGYHIEEYDPKNPKSKALDDEWIF